MNLDPLSILPFTSLRSLLLFGSYARGEQDEFSDVDVCAFVEDVEFGELSRLKQEISSRIEISPESLSMYIVPVAEQMRERGSLFLWHLRLEGKILFDRDGFAQEILSTLSVFTDYARELTIYRDLWEGVLDTLHTYGELSEFDLHILQGIIRDCCILLCYFRGCPAFGRNSAFESAVEFFPELHACRDLFGQLTGWHLIYLRNIPAAGYLPNSSEAEAMVNMVGKVIGLCENQLC